MSQTSHHVPVYRIRMVTAKEMNGLIIGFGALEKWKPKFLYWTKSWICEFFLKSFAKLKVIIFGFGFVSRSFQKTFLTNKKSCLNAVWMWCWLDEKTSALYLMLHFWVVFEATQTQDIEPTNLKDWPVHHQQPKTVKVLPKDQKPDLSTRIDTDRF